MNLFGPPHCQRIDHAIPMVPCLRCGGWVCPMCNQRQVCDPCDMKRSADWDPEETFQAVVGHSSWPSNVPQPVAMAQPKRRCLTRFREGEDRLHDSLRLLIDNPLPFFAFILGMEKENCGPAGEQIHVEFEAFSATWFDQFADDLHDMTPWNRVAIESDYCQIDLVTTAEGIRRIASAMPEGPTSSFREGNWVGLELRMRDPYGGRSGIPVRIFLPADGSVDPVTTGLTLRETGAFVIRSITRVRPTHDRLFKLRKLQATILTQQF